MTPTLRQLEYIVALADTGQFVEAARACAVSQPAMSKQIRKVEEMLGVELFERTRPRVIITPAGLEIVQRAHRLLAEAQELVDAARSFAGTHQGTIRLGAIPTIAPSAADQGRVALVSIQIVTRQGTNPQSEAPAPTY